MMGATLTPGGGIGSADQFAAAARRRDWSVIGVALLLALTTAAAGLWIGMQLPVLPVLLIAAVAVPILFWYYPRLVMYILVAAVCLFEAFPRDFRDSITDKVPFFWNLNTALETYAHVHVKTVPLNVMEIILIVAGVISVLRATAAKRVKLVGGALLVPMLGYLAFVGWAALNGLAQGADYRFVLQDVRPQIYFPLAYLIVVNLAKEREDLSRILRVVVVCIAIKALMYTFRRYVTLAGVEVGDQGVGSHEEVYFFDMAVAILVALAALRVNPRLQRTLLLLLPVIVLANIACNRRAGTAAIVLALPIFLVGACVALPEHRRRLVAFGAVASVGFWVYYTAYKNSTGTLGQPARAIKSQFDPDARDQSSDDYRKGETANLTATIKAAPLQGWGYGRTFLTPVDISYASGNYQYWNIWPHNTMLCVWMRTGTIGFFFFWMMIAAVIARAGYAIRLPDRQARAIGLIGLQAIVMLLVFALVDMGLAQYRNLLIAGLLVGLVEAAVRLTPPPPPPAETPPRPGTRRLRRVRPLAAAGLPQSAARPAL